MNYEHLSDDEILLELAQLTEQNQLLLWWNMVYDWQKEFYDAGAYASQRMLMAANGVGKSQTMCAEVAAHATGEYPDWWQGEKFKRGGFEIWMGSIDNNMQKRGPQRALLGRDLGDFLGTGLIPRQAIKSIELRQAGVKEVCDTTVVQHSSGDSVIIKWVTFEQGWRKWQSGDPKVIAWDEEPDDSIADQKDILDETLTRLVRNNGIFLVGYTPLLGQTQLTEHFMDSDDPSVVYFGATWDDAPHMNEKQRRTIENQYKGKGTKDARTKGVPMLGEGRIFDTDESSFVIRPIQIPDHWARIKSIDFGGVHSHPHALTSLAWDRDSDIVYLYDEWRDNGKTRDHAHAINARNDWIPVAWPHDGMQHDPGSAKRLHKIYRNEHKVKMLKMSARYKNDEGGAQPQWPIIETIGDRLDASTFKVFSTCQKWIQEYRSYHVKDGKIVAKRDDLLKASFYGVMMLRFAKAKTAYVRRQRTAAPFRTAVN